VVVRYQRQLIIAIEAHEEVMCINLNPNSLRLQLLFVIEHELGGLEKIGESFILVKSPSVDSFDAVTRHVEYQVMFPALRVQFMQNYFPDCDRPSPSARGWSFAAEHLGLHVHHLK
jgi:hypothetical protein